MVDGEVVWRAALDAAPAIAFMDALADEARYGIAGADTHHGPFDGSRDEVVHIVSLLDEANFCELPDVALRGTQRGRKREVERCAVWDDAVAHLLIPQVQDHPQVKLEEHVGITAALQQAVRRRAGGCASEVAVPRRYLYVQLRWHLLPPSRP